MAKTEELDLDTAKAGSAGKKRLKLILIIVASFILVSGSVVGALYFTGFLGGKKSTSKAEKAHKAGDKQQEKDSDKEKDKEAANQTKPALYLPLQPALVANFEDPNAGAAYLQIEMQLMARDQHPLDIAKEHMPLIRNNLLLIMSSQKVAELKTRAGKEQLQKAMLDAIRKVVAEGTGGQHHNASDTDKDKDKEKDKSSEHKDTNKAADKADEHAANDGPNIEAVYFTSLIMQ